MIGQTVVPIPDPSPLPAPYWVFKLLLDLTFFLHILAMNTLLGSGLLALLAKWKSGSDDFAGRLFSDISRMLPSLLPATITIGVAPLLFDQVLYGQFFYTSSVIVAWPWLLVIGLLTVAYYCIYFASFRSGQNSGKGARAISISMLLVLAIGFIYSNNITLSQTPDRWRTKYFADPSGWSLNLGEATLIPRYLHFLVAALAIGGLLVAIRGLMKIKSERQYALYQIRFGSRAFIYATMVQFAVGIWFFISLPHSQRMLFMGESIPATLVFLIAIIGSIAALVVISRAARREDPKHGLISGSTLLLLIIALMVISRDALRDSYLARYLSPAPSQTQWEVFPLFLLLFIAGLGLLILMLKRYPFVQRKQRSQTVAK